MTRSVADGSAETPEVTVLMATYNGSRWLDEQLDSVLDQQDVRVRVVALDDGSTDETPALLAQRAARDPRLRVLRATDSSGSAAANFARIVRMTRGDDIRLLAFSDQDDVWMPGKLTRHARLLESGQADAVSSNVTAVDERGRRVPVRKDFPQRRFDYLTEGPGPGCTFLLGPRVRDLVRQQLASPASIASTAQFHDSVVYVIARAAGLVWRIDPWSSVDYRQHDANVFGSNTGVRSAATRFGLIRARWHRGQAIIHARVALEVAPPAERPELERMLALFESRGWRDRLALARRAGELRRRPRDRWIIGLLIAVGIW